MRTQWDRTGERFYETGVNHAVLFPFDKQAKAYAKGVAWNGITSVSESPSGAEATALYADNIKYLNLISNEEFSATVEAYTYPDEFAILDGSASIAEGVNIGQQTRGTFGLVYRTEIGNDTEGTDLGYKLHFIYGATATPSEKSYQTINDSPEAITFSWTLNTTPVAVEGFKPTATVVVDSTKCDANKLKDLEDFIYGTDGSFSYSAVTGTTGKNPVQEGWYEKVGTSYVLSTDTEADNSKTYYKRTETGGTDAQFPLPDKIAEIFA